MTNRFKQAIGSQAACNPSGLAHSLIKWQKEIIDAGGGTDTVRADPACRLLTLQLAYLFNVDELAGAEYNKLIDQCEAASAIPATEGT